MNNFAPRIGFAWRPFGGNRTVLRSGYGIFYGGSLQQFVIVQLGASFPLAKTQTFSRVNNQPSLLTLQNPYPDSLARFTGTTTSVGYEVNPKSSYMQNWNFTLEREFGGGTALEIGYIGSKGTHLGKVYDINQPYYSPALRNADGSLPRPLPYFGQINYFSFDSNSAFQSGSATLRRRMANGFFFRANYTMGKSIDSASQTMGSGAGDYAGAQDSRNLRLDRGLSTFDTRHSVTGNFTYTLPRRLPLPLRDWEFAGTFRAYSGHPYTPLVSNVNLAAGESSRPDRIGWGMLDHPTPDHWFDIAAFPPVPTGAFRIGNSGRNVLTGPSHSNVNLSLMRNFRIQERAKLQMRWEVYNISNHANFSLPVATVNSPNAGSVTSASGARVMQLGARLSF